MRSFLILSESVINSLSSRARPFVNKIIGEDLYRKQGEILRGIQSNPFVSVVGANGTGKDWTTGRLICWWLAMQQEAVVVVIGPTYRQVYDIEWKEDDGRKVSKIVLVGYSPVEFHLMQLFF